MKYDFDTPIERRGTSSAKWDSAEEELIPLWVADMDFPSPREVVEALKRRADHPVFGYTLEPESFYQSVIDWMKRRHGWEIRREWMTYAPGVMPSLNVALLAYSQPGDKVVIQPPVYYPFRGSVLDNGRQLVENPLVLEGGRYFMDFDQLEGVIDERTRLLVLCSPHNPVARVWSRDELGRLAEICAEKDVIILSDEIHHDLIMKGHRHIPMGSASERAAGVTVVLAAATKTFNLAGLSCSVVIAADERLRTRFRGAAGRIWTRGVNAFSCLAAETAYRYGESWLAQVLDYVQGNYDYLVSFLAERLPGARVFPMEGTYLAWVDLRALGASDEELKERILHRARVWLDDGPMFGTGGSGFQRINLACARATLSAALEAMARELI